MVSEIRNKSFKRKGKFSTETQFNERKSARLENICITCRKKSNPNTNQVLLARERKFRFPHTHIHRHADIFTLTRHTARIPFKTAYIVGIRLIRS